MDSASLRQEFWLTAPAEYEALMKVHRMLGAALDQRLFQLVYVRVSQMNGCGFCIDAHSKQAIRAGESAERLAALATWRETSCWSEQERAVLDWAERLTTVELDNGTGRASGLDDAFRALQAHFEPGQLARLGFAIAMMNAFNRVALGFGMPVGLLPGLRSTVERT